MKFSIAVPSYNYGIYISECLNSILFQDYFDFEVLICDGGSTDNSIDIINEFCKTDKRFKLISTSDNGQSDAIVKAFKQSTGEIFCFLNADDLFISKSALSEAFKSFNTYKVDIISFGAYYINAGGRFIKKINLRYHPLDNFSKMKSRTAVIQPSTFWKKHVYIETPFRSNFEFSFDSVFFYECYLKYNWLELNTPLSGYRWHDSNKSGSITSKRVKELTNFEIFKFGKFSYRVFYLKLIALSFYLIENTFFLPNVLKKILRIFINSFSYLTVYKFPSI